MKTTSLTILTMFLFVLGVHGQNPVIQSCIGQVSSDSILATLEHLQGFGTRYALANNRREVATWIRNEFFSYGYTDVKLDSFQAEYKDSTYWQYNVICALPGTSAPSEICILGGHYDSYCTLNPDSLAPGVDDNGSAVAATLEAARVIKLLNYQPESTIRFILFAGEELGFWGSNFQTVKSVETGEEITLMMNLDMIAYNPDSLMEVYLFRYKGAGSAYNLASGVYQQYTNLSVVTGPFDFQHRSDSYPFWQSGFQATWAFEYDFNDFYHTAEDVVSNCNIEYCAEITRGALAAIMEMQFLPFPQGITARSSAENITISWKPTINPNLKGYRIFRSENDTAGFVPLNTTLITDTFYVDQSVRTKKDFYYHVKLVNDSLQESVASTVVHGARFDFNDTLLVVACLKDVQSTPDSVLNFYSAILDSIPFRWFDLNKEHPLTLATLSQYRNTLWVINSLDYDYIPDQLAGDVETFFGNHGNMMFAGFSFCRFMLGGIGFPSKIPEGSVVNGYFRIDSVDKKISSYMYRAYPNEEGYDTLWLDTHKSFKPGYPGELSNIEVFTPAQGGNPVYRFDSKYDPGTAQGAQQGKIVGMEYLGNDYKTILLSFPLYYLDTADARRLMKHVIRNKFVNPLGIPWTADSGNSGMKIFPNPSSGLFTLSLPDIFSEGALSILNLNGRELMKQPISGPTAQVDISYLPRGLYTVKVLADGMIQVGKIIKL